MMALRWSQLVVCVAAVVLLYGAGPQPVFYAALLVTAVSFATFCLLYDEPMNRARQRVAAQLMQMSGRGVHAEEFTRLQSSAIRPNAHEKQFQLTFMSAANLVSGVAGLALLVWGIVARMM